jgi:phage repressor protein C with HTH and peptisase S24 domain
MDNIPELLNRLNDSIAFLKGRKIIKTQQDIATKLKYNKGSVSQALNGKNGYLTKDFIKNFTDHFPEINYSWLLTGEGKMLKDSYSDDQDIVSNNTPQEPTGFYYPDVSAAAGMDKEIVNDELKRIPINLPNWEKGIDFINVYGDSMYPKYCSGEIIGVKQVELQYLNYGYAYVVILKDGQVMLKYIKKGCDNDHIILESENKFYEPKEYHLDQIKKVFIIKGVITKTTM